VQSDRVADHPVPPAEGGGTRIARNRHRQRELYGSPLGDRVRRLTGALGITQARLARTLGISPPMLSQLASARRVKIGDPAVLARLQLLDHRCAIAPPRGRAAVDALLEEVGRARMQWTAPEAPSARRPGQARGHDPGAVPSAVGDRVRPPSPVDVLRTVAPPARLAAAAATLAPAFPELAEVLRRAAGPATTRPRGGTDRR
jgi:transcriptional regulator with XRE-family HTH domain